MELRTFLVADLLPHPLSLEIFGQLPDDRLHDLQEDIAERGLMYPVEVDAQHRVICGSQRLRCLRALGWTEVMGILRDELKTEEAIREHLLKDNILRRQLSPGQLYKAGKELERIYAERARVRQLSGLRNVGQQVAEALRESPAGRSGKTADAVAQAIGTSGKTFERLKTIYESDDAALQRQVDMGQVSISAAAAQIREQRTTFTAARLPLDDRRLQVLRCAKWVRQVQRFRHWIERFTLSPQGEQVEVMMAELERTVQALEKVRQGWRGSSSLNSLREEN